MSAKGMDRFEKQMEKLQNVNLGKVSMAGAMFVFDRSQKTVPVLTGELRDSGDVKQDGDGAAVIYNAAHAIAVEFGTSRMPARPFLRNASRDPGLVKTLVDGVKAQVKL